MGIDCRPGGHKGNFGGDENVLILDCGDNDITINLQHAISIVY